MLYLGTTLIPTVDTFGGKTGDITVGNGIQMDEKVVSVKVGSGVAVDSTGVHLKITSARPVTVDSNGYATIKVDTTKGISIDSDGKVYAMVDDERALKFENGVLYVDVDITKGLKIDADNGIQINNGNGLDFADADDSGNQALKVKAGNGITVDGNGVAVNPKSASGIGVTSDGVAVVVNNNSGLKVDSSGVAINAGTGLKFGTASGGMKPLEADIVTSWEATTSDSKIPSEKLVKDEIDDVREIAEGKTKTVVTNIAQMPSLAVQDASVTVTEVKDQEGEVVMNTTTLRPNYGDVVYVVETDYPDRWVSAINYSGTTCTGFVLSKLETAKVPVTDARVDNTTIVSNTIADLGTTGSLTGGTAYNKTTNPVATKAYVDSAISGVGGVDSVKVDDTEVATTDTGSSKKTARLKTWSKYDASYSVDVHATELTVTSMELTPEVREKLYTSTSYYLYGDQTSWTIKDETKSTVIYTTATASNIQPKNGSTVYTPADFDDAQEIMLFDYAETNPLATKSDVTSSISNKKITIKDGDTTIGNFNLNQSIDQTINLNLAEKGYVKSEVMTAGHQVLSIWQGTLNEYNALTPVSTCVYIVTNLSSVE